MLALLAASRLVPTKVASPSVLMVRLPPALIEPAFAVVVVLSLSPQRDAESCYLALQPDDDDAMMQLQSHSITYRIAVGPQQDLKVFSLQTLPPREVESVGSDRVAKEAGFSLHAWVSTEAHQRDKLKRLCRYIT